MTTAFTAAQKAQCAAREVAQRRRVYPRLVAGNRMTQAQADREIAIMEAIAEEYLARAESERAAGDLFGARGGA